MLILFINPLITSKILRNFPKLLAAQQLAVYWNPLRKRRRPLLLFALTLRRRGLLILGNGQDALRLGFALDCLEVVCPTGKKGSLEKAGLDK